ncbi:MAG TPA: hypothetical protein VMZ51_02555 [Acidimicrobiales bacterium]|nr:hypothetical protein [Acidimicrobiales bacterium]
MVVGNQAGTLGTGRTPRGTFHTHHGEHEPCFNPPCTSNVRLDYRQYLPLPGPVLTLTGPEAAATNCDRPVTLTARLTVTGWPQPDVPVTFSISGPGAAAPPTGAGVTDSGGRTRFPFTAAQPRNYTVTAAATYEGEQRSATHTVKFSERPTLSVRLAGPATGQTEEPLTVTATVSDPCGALPGAKVEFEAASANPPPAPWMVPGQANPSRGEAISDAFGRARFAFTGDRAGDYNVIASTSLPTGTRAAATHKLGLAINTLKRADALDLPQGERSISRALMDPAGVYAYFLNTTGLTKVRFPPSSGSAPSPSRTPGRR